MEKETKRILQLVLETMNEQQKEIHALQQRMLRTNGICSDGIADRIERIAQQVRDVECSPSDLS